MEEGSEKRGGGKGGESFNLITKSCVLEWPTRAAVTWQVVGTIPSRTVPCGRSAERQAMLAVQVRTWHEYDDDDDDEAQSGTAVSSRSTWLAGLHGAARRGVVHHAQLLERVNVTTTYIEKYSSITSITTSSSSSSSRIASYNCYTSTASSSSCCCCWVALTCLWICHSADASVITKPTFHLTQSLCIILML